MSQQLLSAPLLRQRGVSRGHTRACSNAVPVLSQHCGVLLNDLPRRQAQGTYTVDPATCTGTMTINVPNGPAFHRNLMIVDGGREIDFVSTDPGFVIAGAMKRQ